MKLTLMGWHVSFEETNQINFGKDKSVIAVRKVYIRKGVKRCKEYIIRETVITPLGFSQRIQHKFKREKYLMDYLLEGKVHEGAKSEHW